MVRKVFSVIFIGIFDAACVGWIMNLIKLFAMFGGDVTRMFIGRIVGVFIPIVGAIVGYM